MAQQKRMSQRLKRRPCRGLSDVLSHAGRRRAGRWRQKEGAKRSEVKTERLPVSPVSVTVRETRQGFPFKAVSSCHC